MLLLNIPTKLYSFLGAYINKIAICSVLPRSIACLHGVLTYSTAAAAWLAILLGALIFVFRQHILGHEVLSEPRLFLFCNDQKVGTGAALDQNKLPVRRLELDRNEL